MLTYVCISRGKKFQQMDQIITWQNGWIFVSLKMIFVENFGYNFRILFTQKFKKQITVSQQQKYYMEHCFFIFLACHTITEDHFLFRGVVSPLLGSIPVLYPLKKPVEECYKLKLAALLKVTLRCCFQGV